MESHMSSTLYRAAKAGDFDYLESDTLWAEINVTSDTTSDERDERRRCHFLSLTQEENNCLHIAARFGHEKFVSEVLLFSPSLLYQKNKKGDSPLHVAARAGHLNVVKVLIGYFQPSPQSDSGSTTGNSATAGEADEEGNIITIQNRVENGAALTDSVQPPTSQSQSTRNSAAAGGDIILEMTTLGLGEAAEGENRGTLLTDFSQLSPNSQSGSTSGTATGISSEWPSLPVWRTQNHDRSTALHEALRNRHRKVALHLLDLEIPDRESVILVVNKKEESPLYLAAEAGFDDILTKILEILKEGGHLSNTHVNGVLDENHIAVVGPKGQTPLHAAVLARSPESVEVLHESIPELVKKQDSCGKSALYYATQGNSLNMMRLLLKLDASSAYLRDKDDGLSPLLVAASIGNRASVQAILDACPTSIESMDNHGCNSLHLAVIHNTPRMVRNFLRIPEMRTLINEPDLDGNTPLHLATMGHKSQAVEALLSARHVDLTAKNNLGQTALDLCALEWGLTARQSQIWLSLNSRKASFGRFRPLMRLPPSFSILGLMPSADGADLKQVANMLAVVASLLTTITFAAVLQIPGGYKGDGPYMGSPLLIHRTALKVFFLSDTISLCLSTVALFPLIVATRGDKAFLAATINYSQVLVIFALYAASIAFVSGIYLVVSIECMWLATFVCILAPFFSGFSGRIYNAAIRRTPFVQGLLKKHRTRVISSEQQPEE